MQTLRRIPYYGSLALLAYMPFHVFLSQWLSTFTGGLDVWKLAKDVVAMALLLLSLGLVVWTRAYRQTPYLKLAGLALVYLVLHVAVYYWRNDTSFGVASLATVYNNRILWFLIIGLSAKLLTPELVDVKRISKLVIIVSTIVVSLGLLQYLLPKDLLEHFGYAVERGVKPMFFIDDKPDLPRIMATLRDPNSFAAWLILPITMLWCWLLDKRQQAKRLLIGGLLLLHALALWLTFSRAALAGIAVSLGVVVLATKRQRLAVWARRFWLPAAVTAAILLSGAYILRDQYIIQNVIFHSDETTASELDSNDYHLAFAQRGLQGIKAEPLGHGPGTAGVVSIQNEGKGLLTENYFIQIAYEAGVLALGLLLLAIYMVQRRLGKNLNSGLAAGLFAAGIAYLGLGMVSHLWTNEVVAVYWWMLAGLMMSRDNI